MKHEFPKTITQTMYLHADVNDPKNLEINTYALPDLEWLICYGTVEVTVNVPENLPDPTELRIEALEKEHQRIQSEASSKLHNIRDQIDRLKAITYEPEAS